MLTLKRHIWIALVVGIIFFLVLAFSYFPVIETMQSTGSLKLEAPIVHIGFIGIGAFVLYILVVLTLVLRSNPDKLSLEEY